MSSSLSRAASHYRLHLQTHRFISRNVVKAYITQRTIGHGSLSPAPTSNFSGTLEFVKGLQTDLKATEASAESSSKATEDEGKEPSKPSGEITMKKKKKKRKEGLTTPVDGTTDVNALLDMLTSASKSDGASNINADGWGPDELAPKEQDESRASKPRKPKTVRRDNPNTRKLPSYTKRIEGIIDPSKNGSPVLSDLESPSGPAPIAKLAHGLDRVLFNPGVHWMQDPRSRVYNFSPYLQTIPDVKDFAFEKVGTFVKSSRDDALRKLAIARGKKFGGSTSSLTGILSHIYFLISEDRTVDTSNLSRHFINLAANFTPAQRMPVSITLQHRDGVHLIDSDNTDDDNTDLHILLFQGTMLESFLTTPRSSFEPLLRSSGIEELKLPDNTNTAYRYAMSENFVMRSQLDCHDDRLPGTGVFDIKTRAAISIRLDCLNYKEGSGYLIRKSQGLMESFEREYYDMIRSAFLKYSFQARIGNMDGVFVAYHNTSRIFGFQYIPVTEMDARLFGGEDRGDRVFEKCIGLLEAISNEIVGYFPRQSISCMVEKLEGEGFMHVWLQPVDATPGDPMVQLDVSAQSFINGKPGSGFDAINGVDKPWLLLWSIAHSSLPQQVIKDNFERAKQRKAQSYCIPTGVDPSDVGKLAASPDYGFSHTPPNLAAAEVSGREERLLSETMFQPATGIILKLRRLAREGREDTEKWKTEEEVQGVQVWKQSADDGEAQVET